MKVHDIGFGVLANHDESLHFTQDNDENIICMETGEVMFIIERNENGVIVEIDYAIDLEWLEKAIEENIAMRQKLNAKC